MAGISRREKEKLIHEAEIINAAERIFFEKGFDGASMDEIAAAAEFTKKTIYQYFAGKEDLYFAVALKAFKQLVSYFESALAEGKTGLEKIRLSGLAYYSFSQDFPDAFRVLNHCHFIKIGKDSSPNFQEMNRLGNQMFDSFAAAIEAGKAEGSIRPDLDAKMGAVSAVMLTTGFFYMLAEKGDNFTKYSGIDREQFIQFTFDLLNNAIRAN